MGVFFVFQKNILLNEYLYKEGENMEKNSLMEYGWAIIIVIVLIILIGLASPYSEYLFNSTSGLFTVFSKTSNKTIMTDNFAGGDPITKISNYSKAEIDSSPFLYPIGKNDPYYVVVAFDENYTSAVITKNGKNSDGYMMGWNYNATEESKYSPMRQHADTLISVTINNDVKNVGQSAFLKCSELQSITFGENMISLDYASFMQCDSLESVELPKTLKDIGYMVFRQCSNLTSVKMGDNVTNIGNYAFFSCEKLKEINLSKSLLTLGNSSIHGCRSLEKISLPNKLQSIGKSAFQVCYSLTSITIPDSCTKIDSQAFLDCRNLQYVSLPDTLKYMGERIFSNTKLTELTIPRDVETIEASPIYNGKFTKLDVHPENKYFTVVDNVLFDKDVTRLISVPNNLPENYTTPSTVEVVDRFAFNYAQNTRNIILTEGVTTIKAYAFDYTGTNAAITIPDSLTSFDESAFSRGVEMRYFNVSNNNAILRVENKALYNKDMTVLYSVPLGYTEESFVVPDTVTRIYASAFSPIGHSASLNTLVIPESVVDFSYEGYVDYPAIEIIYGKSGTVAEGFANLIGAEFIEM